MAESEQQRMYVMKNEVGSRGPPSLKWEDRVLEYVREMRGG